jgi:hypothetical protein
MHRRERAAGAQGRYPAWYAGRMDLQPPIAHRHAVQFYGDDRSLCNTVSGFLSEGLIAGEPAVIIASDTHQTAILDRLRERLIDVEKARREGDLLVLDAQATLDLFMFGEFPDARAFDEKVGYAIEQAFARRSPVLVRAYGEMVDILWKGGQEEAAVRLEILWNKLVTRYHFALLCGYSMGSFYKEAEKLQRICDQHTDVRMPNTHVVPFDRNRVKSA